MVGSLLKNDAAKAECRGSNQISWLKPTGKGKSKVIVEFQKLNYFLFQSALAD